MRPEIQTLKAEISADLQAVEDMYQELDRLPADATDEYRLVVEAYFLHNLGFLTPYPHNAGKKAATSRKASQAPSTPINTVTAGEGQKSGKPAGR